MIHLLVYIAFIITQLSLNVKSHSWVECTDYQITKDAHKNYWDQSICKGRPRCSQRQVSSGFGIDTGFNHHDQMCQCSYSESADSYKEVEMAKYKPGQRVCLAYPAKNHAADTCTNPYIPDSGVKIYRTARAATNDNFSKQYKHSNGDHTNGKVDYKGFQNCPKFCENMDKSLCTLCFDLEADIAPGQYSFKWEWAFNGPGDVYSTCWEAEIIAGTTNTGGRPRSTESAFIPKHKTEKPTTVPKIKTTPIPVTPSPKVVKKTPKPFVSSKPRTIKTPKSVKTSKPCTKKSKTTHPVPKSRKNRHRHRHVKSTPHN